MTNKTAVIGAGISGIALSYYLSSLDTPVTKITVFDNKDQAGGCIQSHMENGYLSEWGPNGILNTKIHAASLFENADITDSLVYSSKQSKRKYLNQNSKLLKAPENPIDALFTPIMHLTGKLRILLEPLIKPSEYNKNESVHSFFVRRLGNEAADKMISTLISGIYAGDSKELLMSSAFPVFHKLEKEYGSLIKGAFKSNRNKNKNRTERGKLISGITGMQGIVKALELKCRNTAFKYNTNVTGIIKEGNGFLISTIDKNINRKIDLHELSADCGFSNVEYFDQVVLCCNAKDISKLVKNLDHISHEIVSNIPFAPVAVCALGFDAKNIKHPLDGFGYLTIPKNPAGNVLGCLFSSTLFPGRAPAGKVLLTCITGGTRNPGTIKMHDNELIYAVMSEIEPALGISGSPEYFNIHKNNYAIPQYALNHCDVIKSFNGITVENPGIFICSNAVNGVSVSDRIKDASILSEKISAYIGRNINR